MTPTAHRERRQFGALTRLFAYRFFDTEILSLRGEIASLLGQMAALAANLECEVSPTEVKRLALQFQKSGTALGECRVSGPFNLEKLEGRLQVEVLNIDRQVLNIAGAATGGLGAGQHLDHCRSVFPVRVP